MSETPLKYAETNFGAFVEKLKTLSRIPSISFEGYPAAELERSAEAVAALMRDEGLENVELLRTEGAPPYVYGDWQHAPGKPTLLLYAHHDVQPVGREELWQSPPFEPTERQGRLFGRGTADDKAGVVVHTSAIGSFLKTVGKLPVNVKVLIEGEEEVGSSHLGGFLSKFRQKLSADAVVLTDTGNFDTGIPTITTSLRGIVATEIEVRALKQPVHSGIWGGPVPDPVIALSKMLATLVDANGRIAVPGIYDQVEAPSELELASVHDLNYTETQYREQAGILDGVQLVGGPESPLLKLFRLPAISVNAIQASSRKTPANIVNDVAWAKVSIRTVPRMDGPTTMKHLQDHLRRAVPWGMQVTFRNEQMGAWWVADTSSPAFEKAGRALAKAFGRPTVFLGQGGSIPFVGPFTEVLGGVPALLIGVEDPYTYAHSENESLHLGDFKKSILGAVHLYEIFAE
jgi:acetylornithine deacetylase/succinyl-diaminopimelate desuccinylase-like protein